jgi:hypothetical protein
MTAALVDAGLLDPAEVAGLAPDPGACGAMVDVVVGRARGSEAAP